MKKKQLFLQNLVKSEENMSNITENKRYETE